MDNKYATKENDKHSNYSNSTEEEDMHPERNPDIGQKGGVKTEENPAQKHIKESIDDDHKEQNIPLKGL